MLLYILQTYASGGESPTIRRVARGFNYLLGKGSYVFESVGLFVCLFICLSVRNITQMVMNGLQWIEILYSAPR